MGTLHNTSERKKSDYSHRQRRTRDRRREEGGHQLEKILTLGHRISWRRGVSEAECCESQKKEFRSNNRLAKEE